ncbi:Uncharacterised protein [Streptococcus acidominimus]|uniref:Uncharacterized protein n=1 Tax=Streptococcus acidominimus TaxID=1326 RepID=A0A239X0R9_STRAI|nr:Uncharacterised protein [Streptococcus acidominimus]
MRSRKDKRKEKLSTSDKISLIIVIIELIKLVKEFLE